MARYFVLFPGNFMSSCIMRRYTNCLSDYEYVSRFCEDAAQAYLKCRMDACVSSQRLSLSPISGLMELEPMKHLGYDQADDE